MGRPNVGKSSLMNMLAAAKVSIVDPTPGVTRDRVSTVVRLTGPNQGDRDRFIELIDTGGYGVYVADGARYDDAGEDLSRLTDQIENQIAAAVDTADMILFVIDAQSGVTALDETVAKLLRERALGGKGRRALPVQVVANKVDAHNWEPHAIEAAGMGFGEAWPVSAATNYLRRNFVERLHEHVPVVQGESKTTMEEVFPEMRIALVGKRNAGKSSFVNALAGAERCIVSEIPGTTRDAIDVRFEMDGRTLLAIDTAGVRKRTKFADRVEHYAFSRMRQAVDRADVVLLLIDSTQDISAIDKRLGAYVAGEYKPCIIVVTKWDLVEGKPNRKGATVTADDYRDYIEEELTGLTYCPIIFTSSVDRMGMKESVDLAFELFKQSQERVKTSQLNELMREILSKRGPSSKLGTQAKVLYVSQVRTQPPTILLVVNKPDLFTSKYQRYLMNRFREELPFKEVPIKLIIRERQRAGLKELLSGQHKRAKAEAALSAEIDEAEIEGLITEAEMEEAARADAMEGDEE